MIQSEERNPSVAEQKARIRERYKGIDPNELEVVPAVPKVSLYDEKKQLNVAVYARVSTDDPRQTSSYELQKNHYMDVVSKHPNWVLYDMYADEGISGTSLKHRDSFVRMIQDCRQHKIDLIVTKSVSRFARNVLDCIGYVRKLKEMVPPIGVFFETENLYTLDNNSEMSLSFISTLAQEESHNKSEIMNASIEMRFRRGIFLTPSLLGYDKDDDGNLVVNEDEADIVRLIFFLYLYGFSCQQIADKLTALGCKTKRGNTHWSSGSVLGVLTNERHCGDVLARKTFTPNYLDHKSKKNRKDRNQYIKKDHHDPIVSRDDYIAVQHMLQNAKYGNKSPIPELHVVDSGSLKGFVSINPRWGGFTLDDYKEAALSVYSSDGSLPDNSVIEVRAEDGDFDLHEFQLAHGQFFSSANQCQASFSTDSFHFNGFCVKKLLGAEYIELLLQPNLCLLAVRPTKAENRNFIRWISFSDGEAKPRILSGAAYLSRIFELMEWNKSYRYRIVGYRVCKVSPYLLFDLHDAEAFIPLIPNEPSKSSSGRGTSIHAYPADWASNFGNNFYYQPISSQFSNSSTSTQTIPYLPSGVPKATSRDVLESHIETLVTKLEDADHERRENAEQQ